MRRRSCGIKSLYCVPDIRKGVLTPSTRTIFFTPDLFNVLCSEKYLKLWFLKNVLFMIHLEFSSSSFLKKNYYQCFHRLITNVTEVLLKCLAQILLIKFYILPKLINIPFNTFQQVWTISLTPSFKFNK